MSAGALTLADALRLADEVTPAPATAHEALRVLRGALIEAYGLDTTGGVRSLSWWEQRDHIAALIETAPPAHSSTRIK